MADRVEHQTHPLRGRRVLRCGWSRGVESLAGVPGLAAAHESSRPMRLADLTYQAAGAWSSLRLAFEEASNHNLLSPEGRRGFANRMRTHRLEREREESEEQQDML